MSAVQTRALARENVAKARRVLELVHAAKVSRPPVGPVAEVAHLERLIEAHTALGTAYFEATSGYRPGSLPHNAMVDQHRTTASYVTRLSEDLAAKRAEVARLRGER